MVAARQDTEADLNKQTNKQDYEGLSDQTGITQEGHRAMPAHMLLKAVEKLDEEYEQPLSSSVLGIVTDFRAAVLSILANLMQNRLNVLSDLNAKRDAISNVGNTAGGFDLPTFVVNRNTQESQVRTLKTAVDDCDDPDNAPTDVTTQCEALQTQRMLIAAHECGDRPASDQICGQQGVQPDDDNVMQASSWDSFISARGPYCTVYDRPSLPWPAFLTEYQDMVSGCAGEVTDNANRISTYNSACVSADNDYQVAYCNWRNHWIEGCTRDLRQDYNDLVQAYLGARTSMINVLDPEWNAEFITIKKILCFLNVWLGRANAELLGNGDMHAHATKEFCMDQHLNPINPADMNTGEIEGITADLRPHLPDPATLVPALGNVCDYSVVDEAFFGYSAGGFTCADPLAIIPLRTEIDLTGTYIPTQVSQGVTQTQTAVVVQRSSSSPTTYDVTGDFDQTIEVGGTWSSIQLTLTHHQNADGPWSTHSVLVERGADGTVSRIEWANHWDWIRT
eukprot:gnl/TRDRNA2_/TRDRNA2_168871_c0_seq4.p1 gnl/TRDRNA2_/TRDRNA2_168871_c0~~gnl/TRDRNA2_/TRDRNA2_168871_c0_seq4.p1  ORF type:complete len:581 (-),score=49.91 gnl/TRDRNA2_/TRDRNA2_168871_c0_seq4:252-1775(-)